MSETKDTKDNVVPIAPPEPKTLLQTLAEQIPQLAQQADELQRRAIQTRGQMEGLQHAYNLLLKEEEKKGQGEPK